MSKPTSFRLDLNRPHVSAVCPFCSNGQTYTAGFTSGDDGVLLHEEPRCKQFEELSVNDFLEAARLSGAKALSGGGYKS
jgi:hypothetical protein